MITKGEKIQPKQGGQFRGHRSWRRKKLWWAWPKTHGTENNRLRKKISASTLKTPVEFGFASRRWTQEKGNQKISMACRTQKEGGRFKGASTRGC